MVTVVENENGRVWFDEQEKILYICDVEIGFRNQGNLAYLTDILGVCRAYGEYRNCCEQFFLDCGRQYTGTGEPAISTTFERAVKFMAACTDDEYRLLQEFVRGYYQKMYPFAGEERNHGRAIVVCGCAYCGAKNSFISDWCSCTRISSTEFLAMPVLLAPANRDNLVVECEGGDPLENSRIVHRLCERNYKITLLWFMAACPFEECEKKDSIWQATGLLFAGWDLRPGYIGKIDGVEQFWMAYAPFPERLQQITSPAMSLEGAGVVLRQLPAPGSGSYCETRQIDNDYIRAVRDAAPVAMYPCEKYLRGLGLYA